MKNLLFALTLFCSSFLGAQQIQGLVTDENNEPLPGVSVQNLNTGSGVITDFDGKFSIISSVGDVLKLSYLGYLTQEITIESNDSTIRIQMKPDVAQLEEVVIVGYGSQRKKDVTGSISSINTERLENKPNNNFLQALQGSISGLNITTNSSSAEQNDVSIIVRGRNSINASNSPLIILDGIPFAGSISEINPNDIASITVLKDASSTAIYGSRGANGVILITSKRGDGKGDPKISFTSSIGQNEIANIPKIYDGKGFAEFKESREPGSLTPTELDVLNSGKFANWLELGTRTGVRQDYLISAIGSSVNTNYYISIGNQNTQGVTINDKFERTSLRVNLGTNLTSDLKLNTSNQLSFIDRSGLTPSFGGEADGLYFTNPLTNPYNADGSVSIFPWPEEQFFQNPLSTVNTVDDNKSYSVFSANSLEYTPRFIKGLTLKINTGVEYQNRTIGRFYGRDTARGFKVNSEAYTFDRVNKNITVENILNYNNSFGKHNIDLTALYSSQQYISEQRSLTGLGFPSDLLTYYQFNLATGLTPENDFSKNTLISQMGRLNYSFDNRFYVTATVRRDGYSGFGENSKYGIFPSVALGWNLNEESFFNSSSVDILKLRLSSGENGNQAVGNYDNLARLSDRSYLEGDVTAPGFVPSRLANNNLSWETTHTTNFGMDLALWSGKLFLTTDVYSARTFDLLLDREIPSVHGITSITQNIGETKNFGIDGSFRYRVFDDSSKFNWNISGNATYNKNEIVSLFGKDQDDVANELFIGQPIRVNYGYMFDGIWQEGDNISDSAQPDAQPGDVRVLDLDNTSLDGDGNIIKQISQEDRMVIGQQDPKFLWGLENTFNYKDFSLYVFIHGVHGVTKRNPLFDENVFGGVQRNWFVLDYWTPENPINTNHRNNEDANVNGVRMYQNADFARLKDITLAYTVQDLNFIQSMKLYATARNLLTITNWSGLDPELSNQFATPLQKEFVVGLNITLK